MFAYLYRSTPANRIRFVSRVIKPVYSRARFCCLCAAYRLKRFLMLRLCNVFEKSISTVPRAAALSSATMVKYLKQNEAVDIDQELFNVYKFSVDQLMELAGLSCATAVHKCFPPGRGRDRALVLCGPGNNGGDGLVCARHMKHFGYAPEVYYPVPTDKPLYRNLAHQCVASGVPVSNRLPDDMNVFDVLVDALFGFSFKSPVRPAFLLVMDALRMTDRPICSIDVPSGWNVEGVPDSDAISPELLISLTAPKECARSFKGKYHYLGGRFVPKELEEKYQLQLPPYPGTECCVQL